MKTKTPQEVIEEGLKEFEQKFFVKNGELSVETYVDAEAWLRTYSQKLVEVTRVEAGERGKFRELHSKWDGRADSELLTEIEKLSK